jgi:division protein CdvB (Snf7/Vps24/ESCRT-III family)
MDNNKFNQIYLNKKSEQLRKWNRVIERLINKAQEANEAGKDLIHEHIKNIQVQKSKIENILDQLQTAENERWDISKTNLDNNWMTFRESILKASNAAKNIINK